MSATPNRSVPIKTVTTLAMNPFDIGTIGNIINIGTHGKFYYLYAVIAHLSE